jgi:Dolichyl-phosphate-mannose-protein mannosyltransferase
LIGVLRIRRYAGDPAVVLVLVACALRAVQYFGRRSFQFDELSLVLNIQNRSLAELVSRPLDEYQVAPAAFMAAVKIASTLFGVNELALRLVPWLCALAAVALFWRVARRVLGPPALIAGMALFAGSPSLIFFAANLKQYSGDVAVSLLLVLCALAILERPDDRRIVAAGLVAGLPLFLSQPGIVTASVVGLLLAIWALATSSAPRLKSIAWLGVVWGACATAAGLLSLQQLDSQTSSYMQRFWQDGFTPAPWHGLDALLWVPARLRDALGFMMFFVAAEWPGVRELVDLCAALSIVGFVVLWRKSPWTTAMIVAPVVAVVLAASSRVLPFEGRTGLHAGWPLALLLIAGMDALCQPLSGLPRRAALSLMMTVAFMPLLLVVLVGHLPFHYQESRPVLAALASRWRPGDRLYVYYSARKAISFYGPQYGLTDWWSGPCHREDPRSYFREIDRFRGQPRVWFFFTHAALGYREPELIRSYFEAIGLERDRVPDPFGDRGQAEAAAQLYDLSDPGRLSAATAETYDYPDPKSGGPRVLCDGTRLAP